MDRARQWELAYRQQLEYAQRPDGSGANARIPNGTHATPGVVTLDSGITVGKLQIGSSNGLSVTGGGVVFGERAQRGFDLVVEIRGSGRGIAGEEDARIVGSSRRA